MHRSAPRTTARARLRRTAAAVGTAAVAGLLALGAAAPASAAPEDTGWVRIAHLSPDTKAVDVSLTALSGGEQLYSLSDVGYGVVSEYMPLAAGTYTVAMTDPGATAGAPPAIQGTVEVAAGTATTVAAIGRNSDLALKTFPDDLSAPAAGSARVRLLQASTTERSVDVSTTTGIPIAKDAVAGSVTGYAEVPSGPWDLSLVARTTRSAASVNLPAGSVATLFVLDDASGGVTLNPVIDSASVGDMPVGGVETGGGGLAHSDASSSAIAVTGVLAALALLLGLPGLRRRVRAAR